MTYKPVTRGNPRVSSDYVKSETILHRRALWLLLVMVSCFYFWARWAEITEVPRAPGVVIESSKTKVVQSPETGVVAEIFVSEGTRVQSGQLVVTLEREQSASAVAEIEAEKASLQAVKARLQAEIDGKSLAFPDELVGYPAFISAQEALYRTRQRALRDELKSIDEVSRNLEAELTLLRPLLQQNDVSEVEVLRLERQLEENKGRSTNIRNNFLRDSAAELSRIEEQLASVKQRLNQSQDRLDRTELRAPVNGIVKNLAVTTIGGVVAPGEVILEILPIDDSLIIEIEIPPAEIAFVSLGMPATIKMDAYDYTVFGDLSGELVYVSPDTLVKESETGTTAFYRAQIETTGKRFSKRPDFQFNIIPGMTATVEVETGSNTVMSYLTKPVTKTLGNALGER